jgi:hypothetical protein
MGAAGARLVRSAGRSRAFPIAISLLSLAGVVWWGARQDRPPLPEEGGELLALFAALVVYGIATLIRGQRWHRLLEIADVRMSRRESVELTTVGYMGNNILPARAGELMRVLMGAARSNASRTRVLGTVVAERALDALVLAVLLFVFATDVVPGAVERAAVLVLLAIGLGLGIATLLGHGVARWPSGWLARLAFKAREATAAIHGLRGWDATRLVIVSALVWVAEAAVYLLAGDSIGLHLGAFEAITIMVFANLAALVPAGPGYLGTFDAAVILSLNSLGFADSSAVGYLLVLRFVLFAPITLAGLIVFVSRYAGWGGLRRAELRVEA